MTHDERRLLCLVARSLADAHEEDDEPERARELRNRVHMVQRGARVKDADHGKASV